MGFIHHSRFLTLGTFPTYERYQTIERNMSILGSLCIILSLTIIPAFRSRLTVCGITVFLALVLFGAPDVLAADISFTYVPDYGTKNNLKGKVDDPNYKVAVYILIDGMGWWLKPYTNSFVCPDGNGDWECDITTGGVDEYAIKITAYLLPSEYDPPFRSKEEDEKNSLDKATAIRSARTISFSGYNWSVKSSVDEAAGIFWTVNPGQNYFSHYVNNVWVDEQGRLHLKVTQQNGKWYCAEVRCSDHLGYGKYTFSLSSGFEQINENVVLGLFTYDDETIFPNREIDIEFSRWGTPLNENGQYVIQPWYVTGNIQRFNVIHNSLDSIHSFTWNPQSINFQSHYSDETSIQSWSYEGGNIPRTGTENLRINLWLNAQSPSDGEEVEVVIDKFEFKSSRSTVITPILLLLLDSN